jgi:hypothetical protein
VRTNFAAGALQAKTEKSTSGGGTHEAQRETARAIQQAAKVAAEATRAALEGNNGSDGPIPPVPPMPPMPPMPGIGGKSIVGTLNGGGVDIKITSMNGTITLREAK